MIFVCNKKDMPIIPFDGVVINIMRPSILSNDYSHNPNSAAKTIVSTRKEAISCYESEFLKKVKYNSDFRQEIIRIFRLAKTKHIYLMCCCVPNQCHGMVIKQFLDDWLKNDLYS